MEQKTRLDLYRTMVLIRTFEEAILREYHADKKPAFDIGAGLIPGEMHLSAGQEPVAAGVCAHLSAGIIAGGYPPALGQALALRRRGGDRIAVAVTGEGAATRARSTNR